MIILRGMTLIIKVGFAIGCVVGAIMIFPTWYDVCETIQAILVDVAWIEGGMPALTDFIITVFPYLSVFLIGLAMYIGFSKLLDSATGGSKDNLDGY